MGTEEKTIEVLDNKTELIEQRNKFQKSLIGNILDLKRYQFIKKIKPDFEKVDQQNKHTKVDELIDGHLANAANAKAYIKIIDDLLDLDEKGKLNEAWDKIIETKDGAQLEDGKDEGGVIGEEKKEEKPAQVE